MTTRPSTAGGLAPLHLKSVPARVDFMNERMQRLPAGQVQVSAYGGSKIIVKDLKGRTNGRAGGVVLEEEAVAPTGGYSW